VEFARENDVTSAGGTGRHWYSALGVSTLVHVGAIVLLASVSIRLAADKSGAAVDTRWTAEPIPLEREPLKRLQVLSTLISPADAGQRSAAVNVTNSQLRPLKIDSPRPIEAALAPMSSDVLSSTDLAAYVGELNPTGAGDGTGHGDGFFGISEPGQRFVYVVDCSLSMNHPHASVSKTRFRRLKLELVKSIGKMEPTQEFFIIFFNQQAVPMPARALQLASPQNKQRYLEWAAKIRADGDTDPRVAISLAIRLRPDVIYFLTDGSFEPKAKRALQKLSQQRVTIHTFAMGNREGEQILRQIAQRNNGKFYFIP
jgi:hypothetical protein